MRYSDLDDFRRRAPGTLPAGPVALILAEDDVALGETVSHHKAMGFDAIVVFTPAGAEAPAPAHSAPWYPGWEGAARHVLNAAIAAFPGRWLFWCYNAEFLFFPFCASRRIEDAIAFHEGERRAAMLTTVVDLYPERPGGPLDLVEARIDGSGYYALERTTASDASEETLYGGLRWRFEEHVPQGERRIDRMGLFRADPGLTVGHDGRFDDVERNHAHCPWHRNLTAATASFRAAKALGSNPASAYDIATFDWPGSVPFQGSDQQLMDLGLMEPGQWF